MGQFGNKVSPEGELEPIIFVQPQKIDIDPTQMAHAAMLKQMVQPHDADGQAAIRGLFSKQADLKTQAEQRQQAIEIFGTRFTENLQTNWANRNGVTMRSPRPDDNQIARAEHDRMFFFTSERNEPTLLTNSLGNDEYGFTFEVFDAKGEKIFKIEGLESENDLHRVMRETVVQIIAELDQQNMKSIFDQIQEIGKRGPEDDAAPE